jgi:hypothetical protein
MLPVYLWSSANDPTLGRRIFSFVAKQSSLPCPFSSANTTTTPTTPARRHICLHHHHHHNTTTRLLHRNKTHSTTYRRELYLIHESISTIQWLEAKAKASVEREVARRIRVQRVRNLTARRLACRFVLSSSTHHLDLIDATVENAMLDSISFESAP